jgi:voltage-gated potassium channel
MSNNSYSSGFLHFVLGSTKYKMFNFMVSLVLLLILSAVLEGVKHGYLVINTISSIVFIAGVYAVGRKKKTLIIAAILGLPWFLSEWAFTTSPQSLFTSILFCLFVTVTIFNHILKSKDITADTLYAAVCVYLLLGILWVSIYGSIEYLSPGAVFVSDSLGNSGNISTNELIYYSYTTLSTLGYGDITSITPLTRIISVLEALAGQLFIAFLVARLVSIYTAKALQKS